MFQAEQRFVHDEIGWNYRMTNLQAALGVAQLERIDEFVTKKRWIGKLYDELLQELHDKIEIPIANTDYAENIYWVYGIVLKDSVPMNAKEIMTKLAERGIGSRPFFYPMHLQPVYNKQGWYENESYPVAEKMAERGFYVPSGMALTEDNIYEVVKNLKEILAE